MLQKGCESKRGSLQTQAERSYYVCVRLVLRLPAPPQAKYLAACTGKEEDTIMADFSRPKCVPPAETTLLVCCGVVWWLSCVWWLTPRQPLTLPHTRTHPPHADMTVCVPLPPGTFLPLRQQSMAS